MSTRGLPARSCLLRGWGRSMTGLFPVRLFVVGFLLAAVLGAGSGCRRRSAAPGAEAEPRAPAPTSPPAASGAKNDELSHVPQPPPPEPPPPAGAVNAGQGWTTPAPDRMTYGYRVQIFASSQQKRAEEIAAEARTRFREPVYVEYDAPFYKVRVGDCITRAEADALKERASALGYEAPWVAETMVLAR